MPSSPLTGWTWNGESSATPDDLRIPAELDVTTLLLERNVERGLADTVAVREAGGEREALTYRELLALVTDLADRALPWPPGTRIVLHMDTTLEYIVCLLALLRVGLVAVPVPVTATPSDLLEIIDDAQPTALLTHLPQSYLGDRTGASDAGVNANPAYVQLSSRGTVRERLRPLLDREPREQNELSARDLPLRRRQRSDEAYWLYSSGTSGRPKGCRHRHQDVAAGAIMYADNVLELKPGERCASFSPVTHSYGLAAGCYYPLWAGGELLLLGTTHYPTAWQRLRATGAQRVFGVPRHFAALLTAVKERPGAHELTLAHSSGEYLPAGLAAEFEEVVDVPVLDAFGSSETFTNPVGSTRAHRRPESSGRVIPGVGHRLVASGRVVHGPGHGELEIASAANALGYWNRPAATDAAFVGGYYRTGDIFERDADGFLYFRGRRSSTFKVFGSFVEPTRVETAIRGVAGIKDAVVFEIRGEHGVAACGAAVVLESGTREPGLAAAIRPACLNAVGAYAVPQTVYVVDSLPTTHSGKLRRADVADYATAWGRALC